MIVVVGLVASGVLAFLAYRVEAYDRDPSPIDLWQFGSWEEDQIRYRLLGRRFESLRANDQRLQRKARWWRGA